MVKNDKDMRTSNKIKRLKRLKEEEEVRQEKEHRFAEEFSEEPMTQKQLDEDLPDNEV